MDSEYSIRIGVGAPEAAVLSVDKEIFRQATLLDLDDDIMHEADGKYNEAVRKGYTKYKQDDKVITALLYVSCRMNMVPLTLHKICDTLRIDYRSINKVYRYLIKKMQLHIPSTNAKEYIEKFAVELRLPKTVLDRAESMLIDPRVATAVSGKGPAGVAAASLCVAGEMEDEIIDHKGISELSGVTCVTIRNRCRELESNLGLNRLAAAI